MLYIGPWLEYELAKLLVEQQTSSRNSKQSTLLSDSSLTVSRSTPSRRKRTARNDAVINGSERRPPVISQPQRSRNSTVEPSTQKTSVNNCSQRSNPLVHQQRRQYSCGEAKSMRQLRNELLSFSTQNTPPVEHRRHKSARGRSTARSRKHSAPIDKRVSQVQRMQQIYRQGKAIAEQEKESRGLNSKRNEYSNRRAGDNLHQHTSLPRSSTPQNKDASLSQLSDDDLISWAGALDIENI